ncbi:hypothetical protein Nepgr_029455 [Nepenthes gracilis]|uniref:AMP-activated protein kinase glycogen-binding domain-containing protein n=1 Tax=Nepenthes gracilis TaxID=150966 RepID=A0AAD3Y311_NEPGR|nr:hypothetical protein Nepgr_029455 [Nepenthes gracilis]
MVSLIADATDLAFSHQSLAYLSSPTFLPVSVVQSPAKPLHQRLRKQRQRKEGRQNQFLLGFSDSSGVLRKCRRWESEETERDSELEAEILEFMKNSRNPEKFPSKRELAEAGRMDLVEAIVNKGGWMSMGWDLDDGVVSNWEVVEPKRGLVGGQIGDQIGDRGRKKVESLEVSSITGDSLPAASSSGRSLEVASQEDTGIEGILNRLEKQRSLSFGLNLGKNGSTCLSSCHAEDGQYEGMLNDVDSCYLERSDHLESLNPDEKQVGVNGSISKLDGLRNMFKPQIWRTAAFEGWASDREFEAGEINLNQSRKRSAAGSSMDDIIATVKGAKEPLEEELNACGKEINRNQIRTRLQHLEAELSSALCLLRSNSSSSPQKVQEHLPDDLRKLSDSWEFQENEIMHARDELRSIRAKLAVLEGKMTLAIIDAQKLADEKQRKIDDVREALQLLRTTCIVWPNSALEVLLAGSFDGWTTQRKMEKSSTGVFSMFLKLYPGRYEIKFIVDGIWKVDPLRPVVHSDGYENNLLIIT